MVKSTMSSLKLVCILVLLGSFLSCVDENSAAKSDKMCPTDGANLYLKCSDGREKVFGIGYGDKPIFVRRKGKWVSEAADEFCADEPMLVDFYFKNIHLQLSGQKTNGDSTTLSWRSADSNCIRLERNNTNQYVTWKIETRPISSPKPEDDKDL